MSSDSIIPDRENLRRALRWITEQDKPNLQLIDEASPPF